MSKRCLRSVMYSSEGHLFVYAVPEGMLDAFNEILQLEDKKDLI